MLIVFLRWEFLPKRVPERKRFPMVGNFRLLSFQRDEEEIQFRGSGFWIFFVADQPPEEGVFAEAVGFFIGGDGREDIGAGNARSAGWRSRNTISFFRKEV